MNAENRKNYANAMEAIQYHWDKADCCVLSSQVSLERALESLNSAIAQSEPARAIIQEELGKVRREVV